MNDAAVMTSLISLAVIAIVSLLACALALRHNADRAQAREKVMADLLIKTVNAVVVSESDQVQRIEAELDHDRPEPPPGVLSSPPTPGQEYEVFGEPRPDPLD